MGKKQRQRRQLYTIYEEDQQYTVNSPELATPAFFDGTAPSIVSMTQPNTQLVTRPNAQTQTQSSTWKSEQSKDKQQFERTRNLLKHFAPELFRNFTNDGEPANIVPRTYNEWLEHRAAMKDLEKQDLIKQIERLSAKRQFAKASGDVHSKFGGANGKRWVDNRSAVLAQKSIWSDWYKPEPDHPYVPWPGTSERTWNGDGRVNSYAKTQCGRFPALPRIPLNETVAPNQWPIAKQWSIDQVGPVLDNGPPAFEVIESNIELDSDLDFEYNGTRLVGDDLMQEVGDKQLEWFGTSWAQGVQADREWRKANIVKLEPL